MTMWERRLPTLDELKPIAGQLSLDDLKASNGRQEETHLTGSTSEQSIRSIPEEATALGGLIEALGSQE